MTDFAFGLALGAVLAVLVLVPLLRDREQRINNLLDECDSLDEEIRVRDNIERSKANRLTAYWN